MDSTRQKNAQAPITYLRPSKGWLSIDFKELWRYRELIFFLTWRDIKVRYKQAVLGVAWAILQPLLTMVIFSVIFGNQAERGIVPGKLIVKINPGL